MERSRFGKYRSMAYALAAGIIWLPAQAQLSLSTPSQVANLWDTVFNGPAPYGIPPLNAARSNFRVIDNVSLWEVYFDTYQDPDTRRPYRQRGVFGVPNNILAPGPGGKYPGLVSTHSVGSTASLEGQGTAIYFAQKGFATLAMYTRKYNDFEGRDFNDFCPDVAGQTTTAYYGNSWVGLAVDQYQAAEWMAQQSEVWQPDSLAFTGHSGGGYATMVAGIFNPRYKILAASAPPATTPDVVGWVNYMGLCPTYPANDIYRMTSYIGTYQAVNNPFMRAKNPDWNLDNTHVFIYGGQNDGAVNPVYLDSTYKYLDNSNCKAFHWSPTGGHGGPESFVRTEAWLNGHYLGRPQTGPRAVLEVTAQNGRNFTFSGAKSTDNDTLISWEYDFGDGTSQNWGATISHLYAVNGPYTVRLIVTDGACLRDTAFLTVNAGGVTLPNFIVSGNDSIWIPEGQTSSFTLSLTVAPASNLSVTIARISGDADISVQSGGAQTFTLTNWNQPRTVVLAAAQDGDQVNGVAAVSITAVNVPSVNLTVTEIEDDATLEIAGDTVSGEPGDTVLVPVSLINPSALGVRSIGATASRDTNALKSPQILAGPQLPPKEDWFLTQQISGNGSQIIAASQFAGPEFRPLTGIMFYVRLIIDPAAVPGSFPIAFSALNVNGSLSPVSRAGAVTVVPSVSILPANRSRKLRPHATLSGNPATGGAWLDYFTPHPSARMNIRLYDLGGRKLADLYSGVPGVSRGRIEVSGAYSNRRGGLSRGLFIIEMETGGFKSAGRVLWLR